MKLPKEIEELKQFFKVFSEKVTEPCYRKPKKWIMAAGLTAAALVGGIVGVVISEYRHGTELEKANIAAAAQIQIAPEDLKNNAETNLAIIGGKYSQKDLDSLNQKVSEAEKQANDAERKAAGFEEKAENLEQAVSEGEKTFEVYKKDHPEEITKEKYDKLLAEFEEFKKSHLEVIAKEAAPDTAVKSSTYNFFIEVLKKLERGPTVTISPRPANLYQDLERIRSMLIDILKDGVINPIDIIATGQGVCDEIRALLLQKNQLIELKLKYGHIDPYLGELSDITQDCINTFASSYQIKGFTIILAKEKTQVSTTFFGYKNEPLFLSGTLARHAKVLNISAEEALGKHKDEEGLSTFSATPGPTSDTIDVRLNHILRMSLVVPRENWANLSQFFPGGELKNKTGERITKKTYELMLNENEISAVYLVYVASFPIEFKFIHEFVKAMNTRTLSQFESLLDNKYKNKDSYVSYADIKEEIFNALVQEYILINPTLQIGLGAIWTEDSNNVKSAGFPHDAPEHKPLLTITLQELAEKLSIQRAADYLTTAYAEGMTSEQLKEYVKLRSLANFASGLSSYYLLLSKEEVEKLDKEKKINLQEGTNYRHLQIIARDIPPDEK